MAIYKALTSKKPETNMAMNGCTFGDTHGDPPPNGGLELAQRTIPYLPSEITTSLAEGKNVFVAAREQSALDCNEH